MLQRTKFSDWLMKKGYTSRWVADRLAAELKRSSFSTNTVDNWRSGKSSPRDKTMIALKKISCGELSADDFLIGDRG